MYAFFLRAVTLSVLYFCLLFVGSSCLTMDIMRLLPGYTVTDKFGALVLLAVFCLMVLGVTELTVKKEIKE